MGILRLRHAAPRVRPPAPAALRRGDRRGRPRRPGARAAAPARAARGQRRGGRAPASAAAGRGSQGRRVLGRAVGALLRGRARPRRLPARAPLPQERPALLPRRRRHPPARAAHRDRPARARQGALVPARPRPPRARPADHERGRRRDHARGLRRQGRRPRRGRGRPPRAHRGPRRRRGPHAARRVVRRRHRPARPAAQQARAQAPQRPPRQRRVVAGQGSRRRRRPGARQRDRLAQPRPRPPALVLDRALHGDRLLAVVHPARAGAGRRGAHLAGHRRARRVPPLRHHPHLRARARLGREARAALLRADQGPAARGLLVPQALQPRLGAVLLGAALVAGRRRRRVRRPVLLARLRLHLGRQLLHHRADQGPPARRRHHRPRGAPRPLLPAHVRRDHGGLPPRRPGLRQPATDGRQGLLGRLRVLVVHLPVLLQGPLQAARGRARPLRPDRRRVRRRSCCASGPAAPTRPSARSTSTCRRSPRSSPTSTSTSPKR